MKKLFLIALFASTSAFSQSEPVLKPADFAARFDITTSSTEPFQRVLLRPEVFRYSQSALLNDVRVFNAAGEVLPFALRQPNERSTPQEAVQNLSAFPVEANVHAAALGGGRMQIQQRAGGTTVVIEGQSNAAPSSAPISDKRVVAYLLDARAVKAKAVALEFDADFDAAKLVPITVEASSDLKSWRTLASAEPVFRLGNAEAGSTRTSVRFTNAGSVEDQFLRVTWANSNTFKLRTVSLKTIVADAAPLVPDAIVPIGVPVVFDGRSAEWALTTPVALAQIDIKPAELNTLVPVKIFGRRRAGEPWLTIGRGVVFRISQNAGGSQSPESLSPPLAISPGSYHALKIEVEGQTGFGATPPQAALHFAPREVVFLARGAGPFTLTTGHADARAASLPLPSLIPGYKVDAERALPQATLAQPVISESLLAKPVQTLFGIDTRRLVLWGVLIAAVLLLAGFAVSLLRKLNQKQ